MKKEIKIAYLSYYKKDKDGGEYSRVYATSNFEEVYRFKKEAKKAKIVHKVNYTWKNVSNKTDHYTVNTNRDKEEKEKVKRQNLWQQLEKWLQSS
jgi:hypothetical protein